MSHWSSCYAIISLRAYKDVANFEKLINLVLSKAPKITGSERNADVKIISFDHCTWQSNPCKHCPYLRLDVTKYRNFKGSIVCPGSDYLTVKQYEKAICQQRRDIFSEIGDIVDYCEIAITGSLRDKHKEETVKEFKAFINHLKNFLPGVFNVDIITKKIQ